MKRIILGLFLFILSFSFYRQAWADIVLPEYLNARCNSGEILVECDTGQHMYPLQKSVVDQLFAINMCQQYENNPKARFISSNKGYNKYCYVAESSVTTMLLYFRSITVLIFTTLLFELMIFYLFKLRSRKAVLSIIFINIITVSLFYLANIYLLPANFISVLLSEIFIFIFEFVFLKIMLPEMDIFRIFISTFVANVTSATVGSLVLILIKNYFKI